MIKIRIHKNLKIFSLFFLLVFNGPLASHDTSFIKYKNYKNSLCLIDRSRCTTLLFKIYKP